MSEFAARVGKLDNLEKSAAGILLYNIGEWANPNFFWLANVAINGWLWIPFGGKPKIFVSEMYRNEVRKARAKPIFVTRLSEILESLPKDKIGIDAAHIPATAFNKISETLKVEDVSESLEIARSVKTKYEAAQITQACKFVKGLFGTFTLPYDGSEAQLKADLEWEMSRKCLEPAFPTIVASGKNIETPHHVPTAEKIREPVLVDLGVRYNGYCSDITRTFGSKYAHLIETVFEHVEPLLMPGAKCADIDAAARRSLGKYARKFITGLGHGVGISVHEDPTISKNSGDTLREGHVITIEPGIYVPNGIRQENMYLITRNGGKKLTKF